MLPPPDTSDQPATTAQVLRRFRVVFNAVRSHFQQVESQVGLGSAQVWALSVVRDQPAIGMGGLARSMDIHQSTASNLVKALLRKALIRTDKTPEDRRHVQLHILPAGVKVLKKAPGPFAGVLPDALATLDAETLERMDRDLALLIAALHADGKAAGIPLAQM